MADKEHVPIIVDSKFNRQRADTDTLRANCTTGYMFTDEAKARGQSEYHHILPIETLQDGSIEPQSKWPFFHNCMAATTWDINEGSNLIGLPTKKPYMAYERRTEDADLLGLESNPFRSQLRNLSVQMFGKSSYGMLPDLPCHKVEHNKYNEELVKYLKRQIWFPLSKEQKACQIDKKDIAGELKSASSHWHDFLKARGSLHGGAAHCWVHRNDNDSYESFWYIPFSMNPGTPQKVKRPSKMPPKKQKGWLKQAFTEVIR